MGAPNWATKGTAQSKAGNTKRAVRSFDACIVGWIGWLEGKTGYDDLVASGAVVVCTLYNSDDCASGAASCSTLALLFASTALHAQLVNGAFENQLTGWTATCPSATQISNGVPLGGGLYSVAMPMLTPTEDCYLFNNIEPMLHQEVPGVVNGDVLSISYWQRGVPIDPTEANLLSSFHFFGSSVIRTHTPCCPTKAQAPTRVHGPNASAPISLPASPRVPPYPSSSGVTRFRTARVAVSVLIMYKYSPMQPLPSAASRRTKSTSDRTRRRTSSGSTSPKHRSACGFSMHKGEV